MNNRTGAEWSVADLMSLATGYWPAAALSAAVDLGIFPAIAAGTRSPGELAECCAASVEPMADLLDALASVGILRREGGGYGFDPGAARFLDPASPACMLDALKMNLDLYPLWGRLAETVREGRPALPPGAHLGQDPARTRRFVLAMHGRALGMAAEMLPVIDPGAGTATLLDVGAGPGTFSRILAENRPGLRVTHMDLPPIQAIARELSSSSPASGRIEYRPGDYRADDYGGPYDAVLYCGALHQEDRASARSVFTRIHRALRPGGVVRVVDLMREPGRAAPAFACLFSLTMRLTSPFGRVFDAGEVSALLLESGFAAPQVRAVPGIPYHCVSAARA
jgi:2-polyprenyl-3-methyl-5-hydroxy-6-metoxy-1,4-benzoquinol methylase